MKRRNRCFRCGVKKPRSKLRVCWLDKVLFQCFECEGKFEAEMPW